MYLSSTKRHAVKDIRQKAKAGVSSCKKAKLFDLGEDLCVEIVLKETIQADIVQEIPGVTRVSERKIRFNAKDITEINKLVETFSNACCVLYIGLY